MSIPRSSGRISGSYARINTDDADEEVIVHSDKKRNCCCLPVCGVRYLPRWALILLISLAFLASLIVVGILVLLPRFVQMMVNQSELQFTSISITQPEANQFHLSAQGYLNNAGFLQADIASSEIDIFYNNEFLGTIVMPALSAKGDSTYISMSSVCHLQNLTVYEGYISNLLKTNGSQVYWILRGKPTISALGMSWQVDFEKSVGITGMGGLGNVTVLKIDLPRNSPYGGIELVLNASQYNPSPVSVFLGTIELEVYYEDSYMGKLWTHNFTLEPGSNLLSLEGYLKPVDLSKASQFMTNYLAGVDTPVYIRGLDAGNSSVEWIQYMVKLLSVHSVMPGAKNLTLMSDIQLQRLAIDFVSNTEQYTGSSIEAGFHSPFAFPLSVVEVSTFLQLMQGSDVFVEINSPFFPAHSDQTEDKVWVSFDHIPATVVNEDLFSDIIADLLLNPSAQVTVKGIANAIATTAMGNVTLMGIHFEQNIVLPGMSGFSKNPIQVVNQTVAGTGVNALQVILGLQVTNPTYLHFSAPFLPFYLMSGNTIIGNSSLAPFVLEPNAINYCQGNSFVIEDGTNDPLISNFLSTNIMGNSLNLTIKGAPDQTNINLLKKSLTKFSSNVLVPGDRVNFLQYFQIAITTQIIHYILPTKITINNPWNVELRLLALHHDVYLTSSGQKIAHLYEDISSNPIVIPPKQSIITDDQPVIIDGISISEWRALIGDLLLTVEGSMTALVNNQFQSTLNYSQASIPCGVFAS